MKASEAKLQRVIEGANQFVVPLFQRKYSWDSKEWNTLWEDLLELYEEESRRNHFIGSIVTMPTQSVPEGVAKYLLIDGQQRFTTIFVLLAVVRDKAKATPDSTLCREIEQTLLTNPFKQGNDRFKLLPTQGDRESFLSVMRGEIGFTEDQITRAYRFFERKIRPSEIPDLEKFMQIIVGQLVLVSIVLERDDNPHLVFESLNAKGRALSQADLIRNYFFMRIHVNDQERLYGTYWTPMQEHLGENLTEFIRHFLMRNGGVIKQGEVYFALKEKADQKTQEEIVAYLQEIAGFAELYLKLLIPALESSTKVSQQMHRLNRIEVTTAYPFLLNVYHDFSVGRISEYEFAEVISVLENFMIRRFVCSVPTYGLNKVFAALYSQASQNPSIAVGVKEALRTKNYPRDVEFRERFVSTKLYGGGDRIEKTKIILERLEESFEHKEPVPFSTLQIEHVMPQTLTASWKEALGENWETVHELLLHTVGNLTLTGYNAPLSNDDYGRKREILLKSHLELNRYFEAVMEWNDPLIRARAEVLAERALRVWSYFGQEQSELESLSRGVTGTTPTGLVILGERFSVSTWREVAQITLETSHERDSERFEQVLAQFPRFVGHDPSRFRSSRQLANGLFFETNLSATSIHRLCVQVSELSGLSSEDWRVEYAPSANRQPEPDTGEQKPELAEFGLSSVERIARQIGETFARLSQARYESSHGVRFLGLSSRTYPGPGGQERFWFGIRRSQLAFLKESDAAWLAFECGSSQKIVLFPFAKFQPFFASLRETEGSHWHVDLREEDGRLVLPLPLTNERIDVSSYVIPP